MPVMSSRHPRRQRRRRERGSTLPRPGAAAPASPQPTAATPARIPEQTRPERHIVTDYRYVRRDLLAAGVVSVMTLAFVLVAAFAF